MSRKTPKKSIAGTPDPANPTRTRRVDWQWLVAGVVILGVSLFLTVSQANDPTASTGLFSGPMGQALNIGGIIGGIWVIWKAFKG